jgi:hypothetical protein
MILSGRSSTEIKNIDPASNRGIELGSGLLELHSLRPESTAASMGEINIGQYWKAIRMNIAIDHELG